jgi:hypothetical protein
MDGRFLQGTFTGTRVLNDPKPDVDCGGAGGLSGLRSLHDFSSILMADGGARSVGPRVSRTVWGHLAARDDGNVIPEF